MRKFVNYKLILTLALSPFFANAATINSLAGLADFFLWITRSLIPIFITLALVAFFWGIAKFILAAGNAEKREEGRKIIIYGIISLFVMITLVGILSFLQATFFGGGYYGGRFY